MPDFEGELRNQKLAIKNFKDMLKPGGILVIDHRNYDEILKSGNVPAKNVYYNVSVCSVKNGIEVLWITFSFNEYCATNTLD